MTEKTQNNMRYFFFSYSFWTNGTEGKGSLTVSCLGFPSYREIKEKAIQQIKNTYQNPEYKISVVIENWIELSEEDYNSWFRKI